MPRLTKSFVDSCKPQTREYIVWDDQIAGFGLRVMPSGRKSFLLKYRVGGGRGGLIRKPSIGVYGNITPEDARSIAKRWMAKVVNGEDPSAQREALRAEPTVSDLLDRFLAEYSLPRNAASTYAKNKRLADSKIRPALGQMKLSQVTPAMIAGFHHMLSKTPIEANRCLALLSTAFKHANVWGLRSGDNPVKGLAKFREKARDRVLTKDELGRLGRALNELENTNANPYGLAAIRLAALTGWRIGEILSLRWENVDLDQRTARISGKTGPRTAPISTVAASVISSLPRLGAFVFPGRLADSPLSYAVVRRLWTQACREAGIAGVRIHDLRHGAATLGARLGASAHTLRDLLGHRTLAMSNRYVSKLVDPVREISDKVADEIAGDLEVK